MVSFSGGVAQTPPEPDSHRAYNTDCGSLDGKTPGKRAQKFRTLRACRVDQVHPSRSEKLPVRFRTHVWYCRACLRVSTPPRWPLGTSMVVPPGHFS